MTSSSHAAIIFTTIIVIVNTVGVIFLKLLGRNISPVSTTSAIILWSHCGWNPSFHNNVVIDALLFLCWVKTFTMCCWVSHLIPIRIILLVLVTHFKIPLSHWVYNRRFCRRILAFKWSYIITASTVSYCSKWLVVLLSVAVFIAAAIILRWYLATLFLGRLLRLQIVDIVEMHKNFDFVVSLEVLLLLFLLLMYQYLTSASIPHFLSTLLAF